jgi:hypothetical protein
MLGSSTLVDIIATTADSDMLGVLQAKRKERNIPSHMIRQLFMAPVKETISRLSTQELALICEEGKDFDSENSKEATIMTDGNNAWSTIPLRPYDTGKVMLQKIATATLLVRIVKLISTGMPVFAKSWVPFEAVGFDKIEALDLKNQQITAALGW